MNDNKLHLIVWLYTPLAALVLGGVVAALAAGDLPTKFSNQGGIANTRHNLTQQQTSGGPASITMDPYRNNYGEVCVYCHTPHGANSNVTLPLWNRTIKSTTYTTYDQLGTSTITQPITQPGASSLSCLSCHDGQVSVDSVINMPGSGRYSAAQATSQSNSFLDAWNNASGVPGGAQKGHMSLAASGGDSCLACHSSGAGFIGAGATDFTAFVIGQDLRNDHPVGVRFPAAGPGVDFNQPTTTRPGMRWFDTNGNSFPDTREVRLYDTGQGFEVECASCHDPHGVPSAGPGSTFNPSFLRVNNAASALCLTCHVK